MKIYFAYGSNLCLKRLKSQERAPSSTYKCTATLNGYKIVFYKKSRDGSGKATIIPDLKSKVQGAIFTYEDIDHENLKRAEAGYKEKIVTVSTSFGDLQAITFICDQDKLDFTLQPYDWYLELIRCSAQNLGLDEEYLIHLNTISSIKDGDDARVKKERFTR